MGLNSTLRRHRHDTRVIVGALTVMLVVFTATFYLLLRSRNLEPALIQDRVLLFALWYANVVLILALLAVLMRIVFKLLVERKHRILGSKFKVKLVATYIGLSLFPVLLMFFFAYQLLEGSIERWFNVPAQQLVDRARDVANSLSQRIEADNLRVATLALEEVTEGHSRDLAQQPGLGNQLQRWLDRSGLDMLAVYEGTDFLRAVVRPQSGIGDLPELDWNFLRKAMRDGRAVKVQPMPELDGRLTLGAVAGPPEGDRQPIVVVAATFVGGTVAHQMQELVQAQLAHQQLVVQKEQLKASHLLLFLMATLLILFASCWVGLYLARRMTVPIQALAEGMHRISSGDLEQRVEVDADDELGVLVAAFNRMSDELKRSHELLEQSNQELVLTNQRQAEERALIATVLQNVTAGVISLDRQGRIFTCNGAARSMLKLREDVRGRLAVDVWQDPERARLVELLAQPEETRGASRQVQMNLLGEWKNFEVTITPMHDAEGRFSGQVMVLEDLTELLKAQKLAAWNEAARRVAHEIKNPLTPIKLAAERLLRKHRQNDPAVGQALEEAVETIVREVTTMQNLVDEFSRFARMPHPQPAEVDLEKLIDETVHLYQGLKDHVEVQARVDPEARVSLVDGEQLRRALINLLDNAVEAMDGPGQVSVHAQRHNGLLQIHVADTGRGIPPEDKRKLFLPYFSTKGRGTGLGLAIVHRIVSDHYGRIRVADNKPRGSIFTLELPAR